MMLDDKLKEILDQLSISLKSIYGAKLKSVILYGSVARGTATTESDIDIMVLVDLSPEEMKNYADQLCDVSTDFGYSEFRAWEQVLPFYRNVANEGVILYAA